MCFDHNFGHHQALNEHSQVIKHIGYNMDPYLLTQQDAIYKLDISVEPLDTSVSECYTIYQTLSVHSAIAVVMLLQPLHKLRNFLADSASAYSRHPIVLECLQQVFHLHKAGKSLYYVSHTGLTGNEATSAATKGNRSAWKFNIRPSLR
jgi:hypothetical protein